MADMGWAPELHAMFELAGQEAQQIDEAQTNALIDATLDQAGSEDCD
jgi:hypothetical protein